jgi:hypothetical protein
MISNSEFVVEEILALVEKGVKSEKGLSGLFKGSS